MALFCEEIRFLMNLFLKHLSKAHVTQDIFAHNIAIKRYILIFLDRGLNA